MCKCHDALKLVHNNYDPSAASVTSVVSVTGKLFFHWSNSIPDDKFFANLIGWTLANVGNAILE